jgi:hypothetical protein
MTKGLQARWRWAVLVAAPLLAYGQSARGPSAVSAHQSCQNFRVSAAPTSVLEPVSGRAVREIDDPYNGERWILLRNQSHPGGPGRLVLLRDIGSAAGQKGQSGSELTACRALQSPVIRAGDLLELEEDTPVVNARLEAVALGPAAIGDAFEARLQIGGKVLRAVALAPGRAALQQETRP